MKISILHSLGAIFLFTITSLQAEGHWDVSTEAACLGRVQSHNIKFIIEDSLAQGIISETGDFRHHFKFEPGFKTSLSFHTSQRKAELSYLWIRPWTSQFTVSREGSVDFAYLPPDLTHASDFKDANTASATDHSHFYQSELMITEWVTPQFKNYFSCAWMAGLAYLDLKDQLDIAFTAGTAPSPYVVQTHNQIPSITMGGNLNFHPVPGFSWGIFAKAGAGVNIISQAMSWRDLNDTVLIANREQNGFSFPLIVDMSLKLFYQCTSQVELTAAYHGICLQGIALAPKQVNIEWQNRLPNRHGMAIIHGATCGFLVKF
ncbi:MAG: hypothetical protein QRY72_03075 [Candidatus Rhabdochlamydia sp.]